MEDQGSEVVFPTKFINFTDDTTLEFDSLTDMCNYLEFWDTDDPSYAEEALILDKYNRRVRLVVEGMWVKAMGLYDEEPIGENELERIVSERRLYWREYFKERAERSLLTRLRRWIVSLWQRN